MRLNYKRTFFAGLAFLSISAFWQLYDNIIPLILKNTFELGDAIIGAVMALDNVLALFLLPLFGTLSDKLNTRLGKRTPFIIVGTLIASCAMVMIPTADQKRNLVMFVISLGIALLAMGSYRSPAVALMPDITPKQLRSKANAIINLMGAIGGVYALIMITLLIPEGEHPNYTPLYISVIVLMLLAVILLVVTIRENKIAQEMQLMEENIPDLEEKKFEKEIATTKEDEKEADMSPEVKRSFCFILLSVFFWFTAYNAVTSAFSRYAQNVWGLVEGSFANCLIVATAAAIISFIPIGIISSKIGRKKTIIYGIILITLSYICGCMFINYHTFINVVFACTGIGWAAISVNSYPMVVEMGKNGNIGKYTGIYYTFSMAAQTLTPILSGVLMQYVSYRTLFPYAVLFSVASLCTMMFVKHGDVVPMKKKSVLENFDVDD